MKLAKTKVILLITILIHAVSLTSCSSGETLDSSINSDMEKTHKTDADSMKKEEDHVPESDKTVEPYDMEDDGDPLAEEEDLSRDNSDFSGNEARDDSDMIEKPDDTPNESENDTDITDPIAAYCEELKTMPQPEIPGGPFSPGFNITHGKPCGDDCYDFGNTLVGAAKLYQDSIVWHDKNAVVILESGNSFGFSGKSIYLKQQSDFSPDNWVMTTQAEFSVEVPENSRRKMGIYFAPDVSGLNTTPNLYKGMLLNSDGDVTDIVKIYPEVKGTGIPDENSALTVKVEPTQNGKNLCDEEENCKPCDDSPANCKVVEVDSGGTIDFTVATYVNPEKVPAEAEKVRQTYLDIIYKDVETGCGSATYEPHQTFETHSMTENSFDDFNSYLHYLSSHGPTLTDPRCFYNVGFILSPCKELTLKSKNIRKTEKGYASFTFALHGHYDPVDSTKWPGGRITYRLKTKN